MSKENGGSAFPIVGDNGMKQENSDGMTLRDYFAAAALPALIAEYYKHGSFALIEETYKIADAMLAERAKC